MSQFCMTVISHCVFGGPAWLGGKVFDSLSWDHWFEPHWIIWVLSWVCPSARHFRVPSQGLGKLRKDVNYVSCRCDMTEILLKAA